MGWRSCAQPETPRAMQATGRRESGRESHESIEILLDGESGTKRRNGGTAERDGAPAPRKDESEGSDGIVAASSGPPTMLSGSRSRGVARPAGGHALDEGAFRSPI